MIKFLVTEKAKRPASTKDQCFYCQQLVGQYHLDDCVLIKKKVRLRLICEYVSSEPNDWDKEMIEFHKNKGSWCTDNAFSDIEEYTKEIGDMCTCGITKFEYIKDESEPYLKES